MDFVVVQEHTPLSDDENPVDEWIRKELATADLGDKRLLKRMELILKRLVESPRESIKSAFRGWSEVMGAYRFFNNKKTSVASMLKPHRDATVARVKEFKRVIVIQDTTELDYTKKKKMEGKGPLSIIERQGFFAHNQLIITPERLPLGVWGTQIYARDEAKHGEGENRKPRPIEEKESFRWLEAYRDACDLSQLAPEVEVIACGDRENDIYEIFQEWRERLDNDQPAAEWLIRCNHNRCLKQGVTEQESEQEPPFRTILDKVDNSPIIGTATLVIKRKIQRKKVKRNRIKTVRSARDALMEIRVTKVTLRPPWRKGRKLSEVSFSVVSAKEINPPQNEDPIDWVLLTSLDVVDYRSAIEVIDLYAARWEIEVFHRVLKTGCKVEELQTKNDERTKVAVALYMIVAWRVMYITKLGRECPDLPCDIVFEKDEWQAFWVIVHDGHPDALAEKPSLGEFVRKLAEFGGFLGRKADGHPGPQSIWQGLTKIRHFAIAWLVFVKKEGFKADKNSS